MNDLALTNVGAFVLSFFIRQELIQTAELKNGSFSMGGRPAERTIQTMELAQIYEMLNGVEGGADAAASLKKEFAVLCNKAKNF